MAAPTIKTFSSADFLALTERAKATPRRRANLNVHASLSPATTPAVEIPPRVFHAYVCVQPGTIGLEVKEGAYIPTPEDDFAAWSPAERSAEVAGYLAWPRTAEPPARSPRPSVERSGSSSDV